ncbi:MAG: hypothetical protein GY869_05870, partial [Planctomycetes bacterium]|nr:hypothetical protein [Planctomycetota bacterium]
ILGMLLVLMAVGDIQGQTRGELDAIRRSPTLTPENILDLEAFVTNLFRTMERANIENRVTNLNESLVELEEISQSNSQQYLVEFARIIKSNYESLYQNGVDLCQQESPELKELGENKKLAAAISLALSGQPSLIEDMKRLLDDESTLVRAWAVKGFVHDNMRGYLTGTDAAADLSGILNSLDVRLTTETSAMVIMHAATVASIVDNTQSTALLKKCTARRVEQYKSWDVDQASADMAILSQVIQVAKQKSDASDRQGATELLRSATELYTAAYHRYRMGKAFQTAEGKAVPLLTEESSLELRNLLIAIEKEFMQICNQPTANARAMAIYMSIQDTSEVGLPNAFDSLLGMAGKVQQAFSIYNGWTAPGELPAPPD